VPDQSADSFAQQEIAPKYFSTLFIRVFVENVPWLVERLGVKVLPCVYSFVDGVSKDRYRCFGIWYQIRMTNAMSRLIGFEELGGNDAFSTGVLELRLSQSGRLLT
jgi:hypothetical protein